METEEKIVVQEEPELFEKEKEEETEKPQKKACEKCKLVLKSKWLRCVLAIAVCIAAVLIVTQTDDKAQIHTITQSSLEKVIEINELATVDYTYNSIAKQYDEKSNVKYYVSYEGTVTAGINFKEITPILIEKEKKIIIKIPEIQLQSIRVDVGTMEYIFTKNKYKKEDISQEAYKLCKEDLKAKAENATALYETARENAISAVEALFKPWVETLDSSYIVEIQ